jgi:hypothetical protein
MAYTDTIKTIVSIYNYQVISINNYVNCYFVSLNRNTTQSFILCRINIELYKPRVKMRDGDTENTCTRTRKLNHQKRMDKGSMREAHLELEDEDACTNHRR